MSQLIGRPIHGQVGPQSFEPHLSAEKIDPSLVQEWRAYLTDCLKNNFSLTATITASDSGGTVLWLSQPGDHRASSLSQDGEATPHVTIEDGSAAATRQTARGDHQMQERMLQEFARECLRDFIRKRVTAA